MKKIGQGNPTSGKGCQGVLRAVNDVPDVLRLLKEDLSEVILFTRSASATVVTPLFPRIKGVVCTTGGDTSHIAIVAREFDLACLMGAQLEFDGEIEGRSCHFDEEGELFLEE